MMKSLRGEGEARVPTRRPWTNPEITVLSFRATMHQSGTSGDGALPGVGGLTVSKRGAGGDADFGENRAVDS